MSWTRITGSAAYDVAACPPRLAFPQCKEPAGERADRGNEIHSFARCVTLDPAGRDKYTGAVSEEYRHTVRGMNFGEALDGIEVLGCEVAFVLNVYDRTCRKIGENIDRNYEDHLASTGQEPLGIYDIPFTVDVLGRSKVLNCPVELDYKSGQSIGEVEEHGQRRTSAAGLMFYYESDTAISRVAYIWEDGTIKPDGHEFSILDAWETCDKLVKAVDAVRSAQIELDMGGTPTVFPDRDKQCKYCSAFDYCPYWNNLIESVARGDVGPPQDDEMLGMLSPEAKAAAFDRVKDVLVAYKKIEDKLKEHIYREALPIDDEYEFRARDQAGKSSFDAAKARGLLVTLLQQQGLSQEEIDAKMAGLNRQGAPFPVIRKRKRELPVIQKSA